MVITVSEEQRQDTADGCRMPRQIFILRSERTNFL